MAFQTVRQISPADLTNVDDSVKYSLGEIVRDETGNEYIYLEGVASTAAGDWVVFYPNDYTTARMTKAEVDKLYPMAVAKAAIGANEYGWYQIKGKATAKLLASCGKETALYTSATAGALDDDSSSQTKVNRVVNLTAVGGSAATSPVWIDYPSAA